jgi:hypothetical protein
MRPLRWLGLADSAAQLVAAAVEIDQAVRGTHDRDPDPAEREHLRSALIKIIAQLAGDPAPDQA